MKNALRLCSFALALSACAQGALPPLPSESAIPVATTLTLIEAPAMLVAGQWTRLSVQVLDQNEQVMTGQVVTAAVLVPEGEAPGVVPGLGNSCRTGLDGEACPIALRSEGPVGRYTVVLTTGSIEAVRHELEVIPDVENVRLSVEFENEEPYFFSNGQRDSLRLRDPLRFASGSRLAVYLRLVDAQDNPLAVPVRVSVPDNVGDDESGDDAWRDRVSLALGSDLDGECPTNTWAEAVEATPGEDGRLVLCLKGGASIGAAVVHIAVPEVLKVDSGSGQLRDFVSLNTNTLPSGDLRLIVEGQPELRCAAGEATQALSLRVVDTAEPPNPVPGQEVRTAFSGLSAVVPEVALSGLDGRLLLRAQCPVRRSESPELTAYLADDPAQTLTFPVEIQVGAVDRVEVRLDNAAPGAPSLRVGTQGVVRLGLFDAQGNTVPGGAVTLSVAQVLSRALTLASPACDAAVGASLNGLTCIAGDDGEVLLEVRAGGVLPGVPVTLTARGHNEGGDDPQAQFAFALVTGQAAQLTLSPNGRMAAVVGADAGTVTVRISDSGGNPVAGVAVGVSAPAALTLSPDTISQDSNADGLVTWRVAQVREAGEHQLSFSAIAPALSQGDEPVELSGSVTIDTGAGLASALRLRTLDGDVVAADPGEQAWVLSGAVGAALPGVYILERINARGGLMAGEGGLALEVLSQPSAGCSALAELASAQFAQNGQIRIGDGVAITLGTAARSCRYRLSVNGGIPLHELVIEQRAGAPVGGSFEYNTGTLQAPSWQAAPERLDGRDSYPNPPGALPASEAYHLRLRNPQDAFGNAVAVGTALQPAADNAFVHPAVPQVQADGEDTVLEFSVAGGVRQGFDAVVVASSQQGWQQAPELRFVVRQLAPVLNRIGVIGIDRKTFRDFSTYSNPWKGRVHSNGDLRQGSGLPSADRIGDGDTVTIDRFAGEDLLFRPGQDCQNCAAEDPDDDLQHHLAEANEAQAQLAKITFIGAANVTWDGSDARGNCVQGGGCSRALITWVDDGRQALGRPQVIGRYPLTRVLSEGDYVYHAYVPIAHLSGGGRFAAAIESDAGDGVMVSNTQPLYGLLKPWMRPRSWRVQLPPIPDRLIQHFRDRGEWEESWPGFARILDVQLIQADSDDADEVLICGDDALGGWVSIVHVDEDRARRGAVPFTGSPVAVRTYYTPGFLADPDSEEIGFDKRFVTGALERPSGCTFVPNSPVGPIVLSFGRPGSELYPGRGDLTVTPVENGLAMPLSDEQIRLNYSPLPMQGAGTRAATELSWASWRTLGAQVAGPVVRFGAHGHCRFAATNNNGRLSLAPCNSGGSFAALAEYPTVAGVDLDGTRTRSTCAGHTCSARAQDGLGTVDVEHSIGQLVAVTDWGGHQGLLRFGRHTPHLAWYLPHRVHGGCQAQDGAIVCPDPVCGDGQLSYGESCEPGAGCNQACRLEGFEGERPPAGLSVSFAPMQFDDITLTQAMAVSPTKLDINPSDGTLGIGDAENLGLRWSGWFRGRQNCRRLGGDLLTAGQWQGVATGGQTASREGPRRHAWGTTPNNAAKTWFRAYVPVRIGALWLGVTPEGVAGLHFLRSVSVYTGEWLRDSSGVSRRVVGTNPQYGHERRVPGEGAGVAGRSEWSDQEPYGFPGTNRPDRYQTTRCIWKHHFP